MRLNATTSSLGLAVLLAFGTAGVAPLHAQANDGTFDTWDTNADGMIAGNEYRDSFRNSDWFDDWDEDNDGLLSDAEFGVGTTGWGMAGSNAEFDTWDTNNDDFLDENEFSMGVFDSWDENNDNALASDEYDAGIDWFE